MDSKQHPCQNHCRPQTIPASTSSIAARKHKFDGVTASSYSLRAHSPNSRVQFRGLKSARLVSSGQIFAFPGQFRLLESSPSLYTMSAARLPEAPTPYEPFSPLRATSTGKEFLAVVLISTQMHDGSQVPQPLAWSVIAAPTRSSALCSIGGAHVSVITQFDGLVFKAFEGTRVAGRIYPSGFPIPVPACCRDAGKRNRKSAAGRVPGRGVAGAFSGMGRVGQMTMAGNPR